MKPKWNKEYGNAIVLRWVEGEEVLKGVGDDAIREPTWDRRLEIVILAKDGFDTSQFSEKLKDKGLVVNFRVMPCG